MAENGNSMDVLTVKTPCKINFRLKVLNRRKDGYHNISSIMVPVAIYDDIDISLRTSGIRVVCPALSIPEKDNIVYKAIEAFFSKAKIDHGISVNITKRIPAGAGLGGGSSDAAAVLKALNTIASNPLSFDVLEDLALKIGADVPFFLKNVPCIAKGVGNIITPIKDWPRFWYVIVTPRVNIATSWVYSNLNLKLTQHEDKAIIRWFGMDRSNVFSMLENDLERVTVGMVPSIQIIKDAMMELGAAGSLMSGSGPSVFGVFESEEKANSAFRSIASRDLGDTFVCAGL